MIINVGGMFDIDMNIHQWKINVRGMFGIDIIKHQ